MSRDTNSNPEISFDFSQSKIAIVQSTYHRHITDILKEGALATLRHYHVGNIYHIGMPGAYELVFGVIKALEGIENLDAAMVLGCVIKGDTDHDIYINQAVASGLSQLELKHKIPIGFGLLTTNTMDQAWERSGGAKGNKGEETALAVLKALSFKLMKIQ